MVQQLVAGIHRFKRDVFRPRAQFFQELAQGQEPQTLFVTCSDSRIDPNLITHTSPGDLFVLRNAGNLIPAYGATSGGEVATIEFAIMALEVRDIVVCGHSHCGAMKGVLNPASLAEMPAVADWLKNAEATRRIMKAKYSQLSGEALLAAAIEENVLMQIENLQTHPAVAVALAEGKLKLHAWVYEIETGEVFAFEDEAEQFLPLGELRPPAAIAHTNPSAHLTSARSGDARFGAKSVS
ncbi:MAG TPA: carbonic anhydrase [Pirellulaceae bacterium]|jgi:carbonic anhydrase